MRSSKIILALWLAASAWAQSLPQNQQVNPPVPPKPTAVQSSKTVAAKSARGAVMPARRSPVSQSSRRKHSRRVSAAPGATAKVAVAADGKTARIVMKGRRDPFVSPVVERMRNESTCTGSGRRCLAVGEITLHGVVRSPSGFIAVVANGEHTYFLRENDPLVDGAVERITKDAIILRERSSDALGRPLTREITKKLGVPAV
jgi:hypothetical protein